MNAIRLSICIPTYNFGEFIGETLRALVEQRMDGVEVVVLDGGSTDDTPAIVERFAAELPGLVYRRLDRPGGIDGDLARAVAAARGEYCWLLSSDDVPAPGAVARIVRELGSGDDVYLCNRTECDRALRPLRSGTWLAPELGDTTFRLSEPGELERYLASARSIGALFSYISSIVVRRERWEASAVDARATGTHYAHVARIFGLLRAGTLRYVRAPLVLCRGENDSFARSGVVRRFMIDVDGYLLLADLLFPDGPTRRAFLHVMTLEHPWYVFAEIRSRLEGAGAWRALATKLHAVGYGAGRLRIAGAIGASAPAISLARAAWFGLKRLRTAVARSRSAPQR